MYIQCSRTPWSQAKSPCADKVPGSAHDTHIVRQKVRPCQIFVC
ncbi:hypothetical protein POX_f07989 [Penicillium oxalicum]|nr:hypothetical protein POX_f07989 [Penicillium oxalicum]KAI2787616.1 hypothetical protein POX_f07989 [Penicillium oxalicum]